MTKLQSIVLIVFALFSLFSQTYGNMRVCTKDMVLDGRCPTGTSGKSCLQEFLDRLGANSTPTNCTCKTRPTNKRKCTCQVVCSK
ncbi:hypothetical protein PHAVU_008G023100 [Phaseolus vulgaris]|uniref:Uncharacterized protein n=1 Tax=Phaseolus vulgaris TaxID=3885 RepID=V7B0E2_PHAVU|nr:hypothetical protein PHAVU_008G023100g [Phaseolus vulgaris]ESW11357.1 hypothetical protein PHAVU_008G023100g [Phaseolus vulgaris]